jgi:hypothetical protein
LLFVYEREFTNKSNMTQCQKPNVLRIDKSVIHKLTMFFKYYQTEQLKMEEVKEALLL